MGAPIIHMGSAGSYTPVFTEISEIRTAYNHTLTDTNLESPGIEILATSDFDNTGDDILQLHRWNVTNDELNGRGAITAFQPDGVAVSAYTRATIMANASLTFICGGSAHVSSVGASDKHLQQNLRVVNTAEAGVAETNENGIVGINLTAGGLVDGVDFSTTLNNENISGTTEGVETLINTIQLEAFETGEHLLFWTVRWNGALNSEGLFGYRIDFDGVDPYNIRSGNAVTVHGFRRQGHESTTAFEAGCAVVDIASTGLKDLDLTIDLEVGSGFGGGGSTRLIGTLIPISKFANVTWKKISTQTTNSSYADVGLELDPITSNKRMLIILSAPCQSVSANALIQTKFVSDGAADLSDGDDFGGGQHTTDSDATNDTDVFPVFNFVDVASLTNERIKVQAGRLGASGQALFNVQDDGTDGANAYLIAIELAT